LAQFGVRRSLLEPLSFGGLAAVASAERISMTVGALIAAAMWRRTRARDVGAARVLTEEPDQAAAIGALGEALVAGKMSALGWPVLRNVILLDGTHSVEIDLLVRISDGILCSGGENLVRIYQRIGGLADLDAASEGWPN
jgi:hypothetical protein